MAPGLWWLAAAPGDAEPANQGHVSNIVLALDAQRVWLLGSGPSPVFGQALACHVKRQFKREVTDLISPWPHPELVLGAAGLGAVRHWAHRDVAQAMRQRCPHCVLRLREQLGADAAHGLDARAVALPQSLFSGAEGRLGAWRWWRLSRGPGGPVTVWQWKDSPAIVAQGLLWGQGAPDARDADVRRMAQATTRLSRLPRPGGTAPLWLGEQGPPAAGLPEHHQRYWRDLLRDVQAAQARGVLETDPPAPPAQLSAQDARHALNWQRAWRQTEGASFQRSLR